MGRVLLCLIIYIGIIRSNNGLCPLICYYIHYYIKHMFYIIVDIITYKRTQTIIRPNNTYIYNKT